MPDSAVQVQGLAEFRKELKLLNAGKKWNGELAKVSRKVSREATTWARAEAAGMGGPFRHFAGSIRGTGGAAGARIGIDQKANSTFWGAKKHSGWYGAPQYNTGPPQSPRWVTAAWQVGGPGGPYAINSAIAAHMDDLIEMYADGIDDVMRRAFPD